jgi:hypothetical protein
VKKKLVTLEKLVTSQIKIHLPRNPAYIKDQNPNEGGFEECHANCQLPGCL